MTREHLTETKPKIKDRSSITGSLKYTKVQKNIKDAIEDCLKDNVETDFTDKITCFRKQ